MSLFKNTAQPEKRDIVMKNGSEGKGCTRRLTKALSLPVGRDRKMRTAQRTNQIAGFVTKPSEKKLFLLFDFVLNYSCCALSLFFFSLLEL